MTQPQESPDSSGSYHYPPLLPTVNQTPQPGINPAGNPINLTPAEFCALQPLVVAFDVTEDHKPYGAKDNLVSCAFASGWDANPYSEVPLPAIPPYNKKDWSCNVGHISQAYADPKLRGWPAVLTVSVSSVSPQPILWELKPRDRSEFLSFNEVDLRNGLTRWDVKWKAVEKYDQIQKHRVWRYNRAMIIALARRRILASRGYNYTLDKYHPLAKWIHATTLLEEDVTQMGAARRHQLELADPALNPQGPPPAFPPGGHGY